MEALPQLLTSSRPMPRPRLTFAAPPADGKAPTPAPEVPAPAVTHVHREDTEAVTAALRRVAQQPKIARLVLTALAAPEQAAVFIWGTRGLGVVEVWDSMLDGRFAWIPWVQNEPSVPLRKLSAAAETWARQRKCARIAAAVNREGPWTRLTGGYVPFRLVIAKEL